jgi:cytochrome P450
MWETNGYKEFSIRLIKFGHFKNNGMVLCEPESVKHVLKDNFQNYVKGDAFYETLNDFLGNGIFATDGPVWKLHRKVATGMFSKKLLRNGTEAALAQAKKLLEKVDGYAARGEAFDIQKMFYAFTMDVFSLIAFGVDLDSQNQPHEFANAFDRVQQISDLRMMNPFWKIRKMFKMFFSEEAILAKDCALMKAFAKTVISSKRRALSADKKSLGPDLISRFLTAAAKNNETVSDKELTDIILNFLIAGRDTTASALSWSIHEFIKNKDVNEKVVKEVRSAIAQVGGADASSIEKLEYEDTFKIVYSKLPYCRAAVSEVLRLHPSVPKDTKYAVKDDVLPNGTVVPAGCATIYTPYAMGRNPKLWPDPLKFDPERWLTKTAGGEDGATSIHKPTMVSDFVYPTFNAGPRLCLGRPLAFLEIQLMLSLLLNKYTFEHAVPTTDEYKQSLVAPLKHGLLVKATKRVD